MSDRFDKKMEVLEALGEALGEAKQAKALLDEIYSWIGPYGRPQVTIPEKLRNDPSFQKFLRDSEPPVGLMIRLQRFYDFDDSE